MKRSWVLLGELEVPGAGWEKDRVQLLGVNSEVFGWHAGDMLQEALSNNNSL